MKTFNKIIYFGILMLIILNINIVYSNSDRPSFEVYNPGETPYPLIENVQVVSITDTQFVIKAKIKDISGIKFAKVYIVYEPDENVVATINLTKRNGIFKSVWNSVDGREGDYYIALYAEDKLGNSIKVDKIAKFTVTKENKIPIADGRVGTSPNPTEKYIEIYGGDVVYFDGSTYSKDIDGSIVKYEWDFDGDGIFDWHSSVTGKTTHSYSEGLYIAKLKVTDNEGAVATDTVTIKVNFRGCHSDEECDDGIFCNGIEICVNHRCERGVPVDCSSLDDQCNVGVCNESAKSCVKQLKIDGIPCNDNKFCTVNDKCISGVCVGTLRDCSDKNPCTKDICDELTDTCKNVEITECIDNDNCCPPDCKGKDNDCPLDLKLNVSIISPEDRSRFIRGENIYFNSLVSGGEAPYNYVWKYYDFRTNKWVDLNISNPSFTKNDFSVGRYMVNLTVTDNAENVESDAIYIYIAPPLEAYIVSPKDGDSFEVLDKITFQAFYAGGVPPYSFEWKSNIDGFIGSSWKFNKYDLSEGTHKITLTVSDNKGFKSMDSINITILSPPSLKVKIISPEKNTFEKSESITFKGEVSGGIPPYIFEWESDREGIIGNSKKVVVNNLSTGKHVITLTVTDKLGNKKSASVDINIVECVTLVNSGDPKDKLDIVFLGDDYTYKDKSKFIRDVDKFYKKLLSYEPFKSNKNKINIYRLDDFVTDLKCHYGGGGIERCILCDNTEPAKYCPHDEVIVIYNNNKYGGCAYLCGHLGFSYRADPRVAVHEFGHSFGCLVDHYVTDPFCMKYHCMMCSIIYDFATSPCDCRYKLEEKLSKYK